MASSRSPLGLRGLKLFGLVPGIVAAPSQPSWAAWIEMFVIIDADACVKSQPSWAAWIEIKVDRLRLPSMAVAALLGCVD